MFSYLSSSEFQLLDLAAVLSHATSTGAGLIIADSHGDTLTLLGQSAAALTANPTHIRFI